MTYVYTIRVISNYTFNSGQHHIRGGEREAGEEEGGSALDRRKHRRTEVSLLYDVILFLLFYFSISVEQK